MSIHTCRHGTRIFQYISWVLVHHIFLFFFAWAMCVLCSFLISTKKKAPLLLHLRHIIICRHRVCDRVRGATTNYKFYSSDAHTLIFIFIFGLGYNAEKYIKMSLCVRMKLCVWQTHKSTSTSARKINRLKLIIWWGIRMGLKNYCATCSVTSNFSRILISRS